MHHVEKGGVRKGDYSAIAGWVAEHADGDGFTLRRGVVRDNGGGGEDGVSGGFVDQDAEEVDVGGGGCQEEGAGVAFVCLAPSGSGESGI